MNKVMVGMSGGVDSSVAAWLLREQGHEVEGLFMKNWEEDDDEEYCAAAVDLKDARQVCERIGIRLHTVNFSSEYWDRVFQYFLDEYQAGRTPNPDVICNREIKFRAFLDHALDLDTDYIATGHYACCEASPSDTCLRKAHDRQKDQSYFLHTLKQDQLQKSLFPLGGIDKSKVREIAKAQAFEVHDKKDSTGICFIGERKFRDFLKRYLPGKPGPILSPEGEALGTHEGAMFYTIGQRQGMGIGGQAHLPEGAWYVADKDIESNTLHVVQGKQHPALFHSRIFTQTIHWISGEPPSDMKNLAAKIRYRQPDQDCSIRKCDDGRYEVSFAEPQWAVAPGQSVVFYKQDRCLGGGIIIGREA